MDDIQELYSARNAVSKALLTKAYHGELTDSFPFVINNANYFVWGETPALIPDRYFEDPEVMYKRQIWQFRRHYDMVEDHFVPYLMPFMGTGVLCSAFGSRVEFVDKMDPASTGNIIRSLDDLDALKQPEIGKDGLMPHVLRFLEYFKQNSHLPVGITDCQGPLTTAIQLCGHENLFCWMYEEPEKVHELMELITDTLIKWIRLQKSVTGEANDCCIGDQGVYVADGIGVWLSDDDAVMLSPHLYSEFVIPYNDMLMKAFGGGIVHWCGCANQHIESLNKMKYLRAVNNFSLADAEALCTLRKGLSMDIALLACDFTPVDYREYYKTLFEDLKIPRQSLIVQSAYTATTGPRNKKYEIVERDEEKVVKELHDILEKYSNLG